MKHIKKYNIDKYKKNYSENGFWNKLKRYAKKAGIKAVYAALILFYILNDNKTPKKDKLIIIGALGYLISPFDFIPDLTPFIGYGDDFSVLILALRSVYLSITPELKNRAKDKLKEWFNKFEDNDIEFRL